MPYSRISYRAYFFKQEPKIQRKASWLIKSHQPICHHVNSIWRAMNSICRRVSFYPDVIIKFVNLHSFDFIRLEDLFDNFNFPLSTDCNPNYIHGALLTLLFNPILHRLTDQITDLNLNTKLSSETSDNKSWIMDNIPPFNFLVIAWKF